MIVFEIQHAFVNFYRLSSLIGFYYNITFFQLRQYGCVTDQYLKLTICTGQSDCLRSSFIVGAVWTFYRNLNHQKDTIFKKKYPTLVLLRLFYGFFYASHHVKGLLWEVVVFAFQNLLKRTYVVAEFYIATWHVGKSFCHVKGL